MTKRKIKKFKLKKFLIFLILLIIIVIILRFFLNIKLRNIIVLNNNYYSDQQIIEKAQLDNYPKFFLINKKKIVKKLKQFDLIEDVKITKKYGYIIELDIKEKKILYYDRSNDIYMASDGNNYKLSSIKGIPTLINYIPTDIAKKFVKEFKKLDTNIISLISEIEYDKTAYDSERFLLTMNDSNTVYINISRLHLLNKYIEIVKKLDNKKGILYLDSGNYFEIKEK